MGEIGGRLQYGVGKTIPVVGPRIVKSKRLSKFATNLIMTTKHPELQQAIHSHHLKNLEYISNIDYYYRLHKDINKRGGADYAHKLHTFTPLIITGDKDNVTPLKTEKILAHKLGATLKIIPGVGHLAHYEKPTEVAEAIVEFLTQ
jgi:pimeloyl-ACP methyl ester carboxylesterase